MKFYIYLVYLGMYNYYLNYIIKKNYIIIEKLQFEYSK